MDPYHSENKGKIEFCFGQHLPCDGVQAGVLWFNFHANKKKGGVSVGVAFVAGKKGGKS